MGIPVCVAKNGRTDYWGTNLERPTRKEVVSFLVVTAVKALFLIQSFFLEEILPPLGKNRCGLDIAG